MNSIDALGDKGYHISQMNKLILYIIFSALLPCYMTWAEASPSLVQAERLFNENLYEDALPLYVELAQSDPSPSIICRLVQVNYELGHYDQVLELAKQHGHTHQEILYLQAMAHKHLGQPAKSRDALLAYLKVGDKTSLFHYADAYFDLGEIEFSLDHLEEAKIAFHSAAQVIASPRSMALTQLYLVRIALLQSDRKEARDILNVLQKSLSKEDPLNLEVSYWMGHLYLAEGDTLAAASQFEKALPKQEASRTEWLSDALYQLGCCYLKLAESPSTTKENQRRYFEKGEQALIRLTQVTPDERSFSHFRRVIPD